MAESPSRYVEPEVSPDRCYFVSGFSSTARARKGKGSSAFQSKASIGDSHIKDAMKHGYSSGTPLPFSDAKSSLSSKKKMKLHQGDSDRNSYCADLMKSTFGGTASTPNDPKPGMAQMMNKKKGLGSSAFRSKAPIGEAHIKGSSHSMHEPMSEHGTLLGKGNKGGCHSAFKSKASIGDSHLQGIHMSDSSGTQATSRPMSSQGSTGCRSVFKSKVTVGDAHIRAMPKQLDVLVTYKDLQ